ncbi:MAG: M48 family metallopeptidase [Acidobacteria bacterium]|nr:M48 family metallopeptidase [Acidobacteriota bacterium]
MSKAADELKPFYVEAFRALDRSGNQMPEISVEFYPYVGINHTIRIRDGRILVRVGEICRTMPPNEHKALAYILVAKLLRRSVPAEARRVYAAYVKGHEVQEKARENKRSLGRKVISGARGAVYDLDGIFEKVNQIYFGGNLEKPVLTWSARRTYRILGHHDPAHRTIVISRSLDDAHVPKFVVEYVMFHEMLHVFHPTKNINGRRMNHTREFRESERKFLYYDDAERWISDNARKLKRKAKRS